MPRLYHFAFCIDALVGHYSAPAQGVYYVLFRAGDETVGVRVLYPKYEISSVLFGIEVIVKCRTDSSHVEGAGG